MSCSGDCELRSGECVARDPTDVYGINTSESDPDPSPPPATESPHQPERRLTVGDSVVILSTSKNTDFIGRMGVIDTDDEDGFPYKIMFGRQRSNVYFKEADVRLATAVSIWFAMVFPFFFFCLFAFLSFFSFRHKEMHHTYPLTLTLTLTLTRTHTARTEGLSCANGRRCTPGGIHLLS